MSDDARELLERLALIPDELREFTVPVAAATARFRLSPELIDALLAQGLRHRRSPDGPILDYFDLKNISLHLGASSPMLAARRFWAAGLNPPTDVPERHSVICYKPRCPDPGHPGVCRYRLATPSGVVERTTERGGPGTVLEATVSIPTRWPELPEPHADLLDVTAGLDFMFLPGGIRTDLDFARRTGMCDCEGSAKLIVEEAARRGLPARSRFGLIIAPPFSSAHSWAEFLVGDRWVPVDPVLLRSMISWGVLDPAGWHERRSTGPVVAAVGDRHVPLAMHNGRAAEVTLATRWIARVAAAEGTHGQGR